MRRGGAASSAGISADWLALEPLLMESLRRLKRKQYLVLACTDAHRFVQFAGEGPGRLRGEVVSDHYLDDDEQLTSAEKQALKAIGWAPPTHADDAPPAKQVKGGSPNWYADFTGLGAPLAAARAAMRTLGGAFRHAPSQVRHHAFTEDGDDLEMPLAGIPAEEEWLSPGFRPEGVGELRAMVAQTLEGTELGTVRHVEGVDAVVDFADVAVYMTAHDDPLSVLLYAVVGPMEESAETHATLNRLNRQRNGARAILYEGQLIVDRVLPADPFVPRQLVEGCVELAAWANTIARQGEGE